jgi:hypothetical protein
VTLRTEAGDQGEATEARAGRCAQRQAIRERLQKPGQAAGGGYQDNSTDELRGKGEKAFTPLLL